MTKVVVTGYASLDYAMRLDRAPQPDTTATILSRPFDWPRLGGSVLHSLQLLLTGYLIGAAAGFRDITPQPLPLLPPPTSHSSSFSSQQPDMHAPCIPQIF